jgi:lactate dehydrogenase-like 2-hydroxyacid dehydrogenase
MKKKVLADMDWLNYMADVVLKERFVEEVELDIRKPETLDDLLELDLSQYWALMRGGVMEHYVKSTSFFEKARNMIIASNPGVGYDDIDIEAATDAGIMVTNTPGVMAEDVAEHAIMLMIAVAKDLTRCDKELREGQWNWERHTGIRLWGKKLAQIGMGRIGTLIAEKCRTAFNMEILVYDPYAPDWQITNVGGKRTSFDDILKEGDVFSINVPLAPETQGMLGIEEFRQMKPNAIVVNTSRGKVIKENELVKALQENLIFGAGIDVFEEEPPKKDNPLLKCHNTVLTQHCASNTHEGVIAMVEEAVKNLLNVIDGKNPQPWDLINKEVLHKENLRFRNYIATLKKL